MPGSPRSSLLSGTLLQDPPPPVSSPPTKDGLSLAGMTTSPGHSMSDSKHSKYTGTVSTFTRQTDRYGGLSRVDASWLRHGGQSSSIPLLSDLLACGWGLCSKTACHSSQSLSGKEGLPEDPTSQWKSRTWPSEDMCVCLVVLCLPPHTCCQCRLGSSCHSPSLSWWQSPGCQGVSRTGPYLWCR